MSFKTIVIQSEAKTSCWAKGEKSRKHPLYVFEILPPYGRLNDNSYFFYHIFSKIFGSFKYLPYICTAIERETLKSNEDGPFV